MKWILGFMLAFTACASSEKNADNSRNSNDRSLDRPLVDEKYTLGADQKALNELRSNVPANKRRENDESSFYMNLMADGTRPPSEIREKFASSLRKKREIFDKDLSKERENFTKDERKKREAFLKEQQQLRENFSRTKHEREEKSEFSRDLDSKRTDFFSNEREKRNDFESDIQERRKSFEDYSREKNNQFNEEYRNYTRAYEENKRQQAQARNKVTAPVSNFAHGQSPNVSPTGQNPNSTSNINSTGNPTVGQNLNPTVNSPSTAIQNSNPNQNQNLEAEQLEQDLQKAKLRSGAPLESGQ